MSHVFFNIVIIIWFVLHFGLLVELKCSCFWCLFVESVYWPVQPDSCASFLMGRWKSTLKLQSKYFSMKFNNTISLVRYSSWLRQLTDGHKNLESWDVPFQPSPNNLSEWLSEVVFCCIFYIILLFGSFLCYSFFPLLSSQTSGFLTWD